MMIYTDKLTPVEEILHPEEFTGRVEILHQLEHWIKEIGRVGASSTSIIAPRRMGKTVLLDRLVNLVFYKPEYKVATFYIKFKREETTLRKFLLLYATEFFRQFIAYCEQDVMLYRKTSIQIQDLLERQSENKATQIVKEHIADFIKRYKNNNHEDARNHWDEFIKIPEQIAVFTGIRVAIIIDEFQDMKFYVYDTDDNGLEKWKHKNQGKPSYAAVDLTATFDRTSLSRKAPMLVSGSAVTLIFKTVMGGPLGGRFDFMYLKTLSIADGATLIKNLINVYVPELSIDLEMAMYASTKVNGHPYYLYSIVTSKYPSKTFDNEEAIDSILEYEIRKGKIYGFWQTHFEENRENINNDNNKEIGKKILYYFTKYSDKEVDIGEIARAINIPEAEVEKKIEKLYYADIVHKEENKFRGFQDICLMRYIQNVYASDIKDVPAIDLRELGLYNFIKGKYFELLMSNAMNMFNGENIILGHCDEKVSIKAPRMKTVIGYQFKEETSNTYEIDIIGRIHEPSMINTIWLCECKYRKAKMSLDEVKKLEDVQVAYLKHLKQLSGRAKELSAMRYYISTAGFTQEALAYMKEKHDVYYSDYEEANAICKQYGTGYDLPVGS